MSVIKVLVLLEHSAWEAIKKYWHKETHKEELAKTGRLYCDNGVSVCLDVTHKRNFHQLEVVDRGKKNEMNRALGHLCAHIG